MNIETEKEEDISIELESKRKKLLRGTIFVWCGFHLFVMTVRSITLGIEYISPFSPLSVFFSLSILAAVNAEKLRTKLAARLILANIGLLLFWIAYISHGFLGAPIHAILFLPALGFLLCGQKTGIVISLLVVAEFLLLIYLNLSGHEFPDHPLKERGVLIARAVSSICVLGLISWICWYYTKVNIEFVETIKQSNQKLVRIAQYKSDFMSNMSHELRTPLNAILGFSRRLKSKYSDSLDERAQHALKCIYTSGKTLLTLVNDILDMAKIESGSFSIALEETNIAIIIADAIDELSILAEDKHLPITFHNELSSEESSVMLDPLRIHQIALNLISNAIKYTPSGKIDVYLSKRLDEKKYITVSFVDTGVGIKEDDFSKLFNKFSRSAAHERSNISGTGLGLVIVDELVKLHGGTIEVESTIGKGSNFTIVLPAQSSQDG